MSTSAEAQEDITSILLLFRKLREGIVAIDRADEFALSSELWLDSYFWLLLIWHSDVDWKIVLVAYNMIL